jgi:uncharacterized protein (UPF0216 family)
MEEIIELLRLNDKMAEELKKIRELLQNKKPIITTPTSTYTYEEEDFIEKPLPRIPPAFLKYIK